MMIRDQRGFTLAELMVATLITMLVLGGAVAMTSQVQKGFRGQIEDSAGEQEGRYALEWVSRLIRAAGNNPYELPKMNDNGTPADPTDDFPILANCPVAEAPATYRWLIMDPDGVNGNDDIRLQTDSYPPDGILGGAACDQKDEDVTISFDAATRSITFLDNNLGGTATVRTDAVIDSLLFVFKDGTHTPTTNPNNVVYVETQITVRTRTINPSTGLPETRLLTQEVRLRGRNF